MSVSRYSIFDKKLLMSSQHADYLRCIQSDDVIANIVEDYLDDTLVRWLEISDSTDGIILTYVDDYDEVRTKVGIPVTSHRCNPKLNISFNTTAIMITLCNTYLSYEMMRKIIDMIASGIVDEGLCNYAMAVRNKLNVFYDEIQCHTYELIDISNSHCNLYLHSHLYIAWREMTLHNSYIMIDAINFKISQELNDYIRDNSNESGRFDHVCGLSVSKMLTIQFAQIFKGIPLINQNKSAVKK